MLALSSEYTPIREKEMIIRAFDDWDILTSTWFEVADYLDVIEKLYENEKFERRHIAALLASKVVIYFHRLINLFTF